MPPPRPVCCCNDQLLHGHYALPALLHDALDAGLDVLYGSEADEQSD